ncbi:MAG TPA: D-glycero-beta-D-manno-heptose-7-phosphate kinase [bacterium]|nr:D-glycero-beta-D-manno-heptose-7-phosphate kinase [bacterium]
MDNAGLRGWIPKFAGKKVLVIGDVMADHYVWGKVERISPEAPIPVVHVQREDLKPGGAANVACNIAALGGQAVLAGVVGDDAMADSLRDKLAELSIDPSGLFRDKDRPTILKTRIIAGHQQVVRVDRERLSPLSPLAAERFKEACLAAVDAADAVLLSDYAKGALTEELCQAVIQKARAQGKVVSVDPKPENVRYYRGASIVTPNLKEAQAMAGAALDNDVMVEAKGIELREKYKLDNVLITRGEHGMSLIPGNGARPLHIPTVAQEVFDVTGAGDTVIATLTLAMAAGMPVADACALSNAAAGIVVGELGVATVSPQRLAAALV